MSIPPLVCSTPPPPEQCEDDKDHEDFDISYNLSQEDDEDCPEYNYGNYSSYNIYETKSENVEKDKWDGNLSNVVESKSEHSMKSEEINGVNFTSHDQLVKENTIFEDSIIEDLNLVVNKDIVHSNNIGSKEFETEPDIDSECSDKDTRIQDEGGTVVTIKDENMDINDSIVNNLNIPIENEILDDTNEDIIINTIEETTNDIQKISLQSDSLQLTNNSEGNTFTNQVIDPSIESHKSGEQVDMKIKEDYSEDDEFGDFEDFQFTASENCESLSVNNENPWGNDCIEDPKFGNFTANFDVIESEPNQSKTDEMVCEAKEIERSTCLEDCNDDFGDFDDFRSSDKTEIADVGEVMLTPDVTLWNLHSPVNDLQIVDSINTVLTSIFVEEIPEPENELLGKLESFLSETWGHLIDIDIRQPYMVNWNNSLGQKTLLKALCIDSRNILFGPKWNYNMPKYAVNLTAAPLQPQKQLVHPNSSNAEPAEKVTNKEAGSWVDPFTPDGQESCNTENESAPTETPKRPIDLNVFESETSTKLSKIYSSTINVQPLRHINLPDTHIFTPTDSETPRSKTIHYDSAPSALIPQPVQENTKSQPENLPSELSDSVEKEYWDFQDFKGSNTVVTATNTGAVEDTVVECPPDTKKTKPGVTYQTQILQPIKLDPIIPTLNWPDPGEVKETFDDFSDFISSTSWNNEKENQAAIASDTQNVNQNIKTPKEAFTTEIVDDEFETFQSAPVSVPAMDFGLNPTAGSQISIPENLTMKVENCDNTSIKVESKNTKKSNSVILENQSSSSMSNNVSNMQDFTFPQTVSGLHNTSTDILQPTSASSSGLTRSQHKSDQILQPLSLESYSQINWPNPGIDLQDLSRFNPINSLHSLKSDSSTSGNSKSASPAHNSVNLASNQASDDDIWGDFVSSAPKQQPTPKKTPTFVDDDEWTDFVSSPSMKPQNGLNTISFNVHTNLSMQKSSSQNNFGPRNSQIPLDLPTLNYITPKSSNRGIYSEKHFQNL